MTWSQQPNTRIHDHRPLTGSYTCQRSIDGCPQACSVSVSIWTSSRIQVSIQPSRVGSLQPSSVLVCRRIIARQPSREKPFSDLLSVEAPSTTGRGGTLVQAILGGLQCPHKTERSSPTRPASVGRPQHSHAAGRTQLITLPPRAGCTPFSDWLVRLRCPPAPDRIVGNGSTTLI